MQKTIFISILSLAFIFNVSAQKDDLQKSEVMMKMLNLKNALLTKDSISLSALLADDVTYGHSNGLIQTKAELIRAVVTGEQDYKAIEPSDMNVRIYDNTGIVTLKLKADLIYGGKPLKLNMNATLTWIKINGEWKLVARQSVKLAE